MASPLQTRSIKLAQRLGEIVFLCLLTAWTIDHRVTHLYLSPDSTSYLAASENLATNGRLAVFVNFPSRSMSPSLEPYTEQPPGFPVYLAPFVLILKDPIVAAALAQALAIALYNIAIYALARALGLHPLLRIGSLILLSTLRPFAIVQNALWTETLFLALSIAAVAAMLDPANPRSSRWMPMATVGLLFAASWVKFSGIANAGWVIPALIQPRSTQRDAACRQPHSSCRRWGLRWTAAAIAAIIAPLPIWLLRNALLYGAPTFSHQVFSTFHLENLAVPFRYLRGMAAGFGPVGPILGAIVITTFFIYPFARPIGKRRDTQTILLLGMASHFLVVWLPSLVASFDAVGERLMEPTLAMGVIAGLYGIDAASKDLQRSGWRYALTLLPFVLLITDGTVRLQVSQPFVDHLDYPEERILWQEIHNIEGFHQSTHFYSDGDFTHQVFAGIPQRIMWDPSVWEDPLALIALLGEGNRPFIVLREDGHEELILERTIDTAGIIFGRIVPPPGGFNIYYLP